MNHSNSPFKKEKRSSQGKGFYIAVAACLVAIGTAAWMTFDSIQSLTDPSDVSSQAESLSLPTSSQSNQLNVDRPVSNVPATPSSSEAESSKTESVPTESNLPTNRPVTPVSSAAPKPVTSTPSPSSAAPKNDRFIMPVPGKVTRPYGDSLYSITLGDWRAHHGVDLAASKGSTVLSIGDGKVLKTFTDDMLGFVVAVAYDDLEVWYCGLGKNPSVKVGEEVRLGQTIGVIAEVPSEIAEESHLHLEIYRDKKPVEPLAAIGQEENAPSEQE